jgi:alpha-ribazole phosphatase
MEVYLVRHTKPAIGKDVCYGQADIPVDEDVFEHAGKAVLTTLPATIDAIYSSPLIRCRTLTEYLLQNKYQYINVSYSPLLKEIHFGEWERKKWNDLNQADLQTWMEDFVNQSPPGGESFTELHQRVNEFLTLLKTCNYKSVIIITHAGVIRSIISHIQQTLLNDAFAINCDYGSVTKLELKFDEI